MKIKSTLLTIYLLPVAAYSVGPSGPPGDAANAMYSLSDICQRLDSGVSGEMRVFSDPSSAPGSKIACSLNELMDKAPAKVADGVNPNQVPAGKKYWGLTDSWGLQTGTMPNNGAKNYTPSAAQQAGGAGYYESIVIDGDANLKPENIRAGVSVFGVVGTYIPEAQTPTAGSTFRDTLKDGSSGPEMVMIPAGSFRMGDIQGGGDSDEQPVHSVSVGQFAMGKFEVTFAEYDKFADATGRSKPDDRIWGRGNRPVIKVSWNDATAYAAWLSDQTGKQYRLPTEAEWEYAARAGTETKYWWGNEIDKSKANYNVNLGKTSPVGSYAANQFGLYDTSGNVYEWTCSLYENKYNGKEKQCVTTGNSLSLRGGSWLGVAWHMRSADRSRSKPTYRSDDVGFRVSMLVTL
ncbi:formylglycine-generating enzyme family protein [Candidatus Marithrix sp. Canyon 246]|uniref:formylglycine-generating enzyme family protein n=1 Tax=Candidatus Marithrix sp. Canyon 246 TaxID=1827136 RepID=UPI00084A211A|nr:formylglycine-generating enzyme family protein [Candidatus Marithrix sp. Canyon 246]